VLGTLLVLLMAAPVVAAPITRNEAFGAAANELPDFFAGDWRPAGELVLYRITGNTGAYVFMFANTPKPADGAPPEETPAAFAARQRASLVDDRKPFSSTASELYGEDRFATIFISADDTEPVVLRCFKGLPAQLVKEADALALAAKAGGSSALHVRRCLMLGMFDEAFLIEPATGTGQVLVVDMRTRSVVTEQEAQARAQTKRAAAVDPERVRLCQAAWARYRLGGKAAAELLSQPGPTSGGRPKSPVITNGESNKQPPVPGPQGK
jgi:hypothetical protein